MLKTYFFSLLPTFYSFLHSPQTKTYPPILRLVTDTFSDLITESSLRVTEPPVIDKPERLYLETTGFEVLEELNEYPIRANKLKTTPIITQTSNSFCIYSPVYCFSCPKELD